MESRPPNAVISQYPVIDRLRQVRFLFGAGGFSGARFWHLETDEGPLCMRRWAPEYPGPNQLRFIHAVLQHSASAGIPVPVPMRTSVGATFVSHEDHLWELSPWLPGRPDLGVPSRERVAAALQCLARFHRATESFECRRRAGLRRGTSPGISRRASMVRDWLGNRGQRLAAAVSRSTDWPEMSDRAGRALSLLPKWAPAISECLARYRECPVPLQPCLRDVRRDHILYDGDVVMGLVDFGAVDFDNVSCDVARLLGSLASSDSVLRDVGLAAYQAIRPLSETEKGLMEAFGSSGALLGALNWAAWVFLDGRRFDEPATVVQRMDALLGELETDSPPPLGEWGLVL